MIKQEFTAVNKKLDGSISECTATLEDGSMTFEESATPAPGAVPVPTEADAGKAVIVDDNGQYELGTISGGTKLYKHTISFSNNAEIIIISSKSTQYDIIEDVGDDIMLFGGLIYDDTEAEYARILAIAGSTVFNYFSVANGALTSIDLYGTTFSDTVTAL